MIHRVIVFTNIFIIFIKQVAKLTSRSLLKIVVYFGRDTNSTFNLEPVQPVTCDSGLVGLNVCQPTYLHSLKEKPFEKCTCVLINGKCVFVARSVRLLFFKSSSRDFHLWLMSCFEAKHLKWFLQNHLFSIHTRN